VTVPEYEAPLVVAEIDKVVSQNGKVTITLKEKPTTAPTAGDFCAIIAINGEEATDLTLSDFAIDEDGITITFIFEAVEQTEAEQSVVVAVKLGEGDEVAAEAFTVEADDLLAKEAAKRAFYETAKENYELYDEDGDTLVANVTFSATTNAITVRFQDMEPMNVFTAASEFFLTILLEELGVKGIAFENDQFMPLSDDLDEILNIATALFREMGIEPMEVLQGTASFNGISVPFTARIQPRGHVLYEDMFTVAFYDDSKEN
ncbi:MAG: hypothetical protein GX060_03980, partial [Firmicutes bacterium]|nr:hypothetical protein [Bacillota bacterium]